MVMQGDTNKIIYRGKDLSRLDLIFTKMVDLKGNVSYMQVPSINDRVMMEMEVIGEVTGDWKL